MTYCNEQIKTERERETDREGRERQIEREGEKQVERGREREK